VASARKIDPELVRAALEKKRAGKALKERERRALAAFERQQREKVCAEVLAAIPKKWWVAHAGPGRDHKVVNGQARLHGIPLLGESIDLAAFVRWFHDFLAANARELSRAKASQNGELTWKERKEKEQALLVEQTRLTRAKELIPAAEVHEVYAVFASAVRRHGENLQRLNSRQASDMYEDLMNELERIITDGE
jgi:hypothetical protein